MTEALASLVQFFADAHAQGRRWPSMRDSAKEVIQSSRIFFLPARGGLTFADLVRLNGGR